MKKTFGIFLVISTLLISPSFAINFDKIIKVANEIDDQQGSKSFKNSVNKKIDKRIDKVVSKIEKRVNKYEKKLDRYEKKIDQAEKAADKAVKIMDSISEAKINKYITIIKYMTIAIAILFSITFLMIIVILMQTTKIKFLLQKIKK